jgi:hypothetical protein
MLNNTTGCQGAVKHISLSSWKDVVGIERRIIEQCSFLAVKARIC